MSVGSITFSIDLYLLPVAYYGKAIPSGAIVNEYMGSIWLEKNEN